MEDIIMGLKESLAKISGSFHKLVPSLLVGINPSGEAAPIQTDSDGKLLATATIAQSGVGWTEEGDATVREAGDVTHDVWTLRVGGVSGTIVQTLTVTYSDAKKTQINSVVRS
jgi:hypothetical protein